MPHTAPDNDWAIELFRGIAATMVMVVHYQTFLGLTLGIFEFLHTGVDLFFVISGFVFAPYFFGRELKPVPFFIRRLLRIYPLYALALLVYAGLRLWQGQPAEHFVAHLLFLHTMVSTDIAFYYNPAFWSLPAEVEFYLALPLLAWSAGRLAFAMLALLALAMHLGLAYHSPSLQGTPVDAWTVMCVHLPGVLVEFMLGALAWQVARQRPSKPVRLALLTAGLLVWFLLAQALSVLSSHNELVTNNLVRGNIGFFFAIPYALMVAGLSGWTAQPSPPLAKFALTAGNLSYGIYLFHNALPTALNGLYPGLPVPVFGLICVILTLFTAALLHHAVEDPARNWGRHWAKKWSAAN